MIYFAFYFAVSGRKFKILFFKDKMPNKTEPSTLACSSP